MKRTVGKTVAALAAFAALMSFAPIEASLNNASSATAGGSEYYGDATCVSNQGWTLGRYSGAAANIGQRSRGYRSGAFETVDSDPIETVTYRFAEWYWNGADGWTVAYSKAFNTGESSYGRGDVWE